MFVLFQYYLSNTTSFFNNSPAHKPNNYVPTLSITKAVFIGKYKHNISTNHIKDVNASQCHKSARFESLCTAEFFTLKSNGVADVMANI